MTFVMLVGLPGSGKSYFGNKSGAPFFDDITQNGGIDAVLNNITNENDCVFLSDYGFIFEETRKNAVTILRNKFPDCYIQWIVWENNPEKCWRNIQHRNDTRKITHEGLMGMSAQYTFKKVSNKTLYMFIHE
jgi:hypothetical protein